MEYASQIEFPLKPSAIANSVWDMSAGYYQKYAKLMYQDFVYKLVEKFPQKKNAIYQDRVFLLAHNPKDLGTKTGSVIITDELQEEAARITNLIERFSKDQNTFKKLFGSLLTEVTTAQELKNLLPDSLFFKRRILVDLQRTQKTEDMAFNNKILFEQYLEHALPLIDYYLGMELFV